jgi:hypothetical protein
MCKVQQAVLVVKQSPFHARTSKSRKWQLACFVHEKAPSSAIYPSQPSPFPWPLSSESYPQHWQEGLQKARLETEAGSLYICRGWSPFHFCPWRDLIDWPNLVTFCTPWVPISYVCLNWYVYWRVPFWVERGIHRRRCQRRLLLCQKCTWLLELHQDVHELDGSACRFGFVACK